MENLRIPGPTPCPPPVLEAMARQMINHRGPEFMQIVNNATANLKKFFQTKNDVFILSGSGTGGMETAIVNVLSPGDKVLAVSIGVFGDRFGTIAQTFGAEVIPLKFEWGTAADPDAVRQALKDNPDVSVIIEGHCDERGSNEYNIALGDRRAQSVKTFLVDMGVAVERLTPISYGEEKPVDTASTEEAWAKNRRAHFVID